MMTEVGRAKTLRFLREVVFVAGAYTAYMLIKRFIVPGVEEEALANAAQAVEWENSLGVFREVGLQGWVLRQGEVLIRFFNWAYILTFFPILITASVIFYFKDRRRYFQYRKLVFVSFVLSLLLFAIFPLAPPRFLPESGLVDAIQQYGPSWYGSRDQAFYYNAFAAMPSLHFGWTVLFGALFFLSGPLWLKVLGIGYPVLTFLAIVVTGNHYFVDAAGGAAVILVSYTVVAAARPFNRWCCTGPGSDTSNPHEHDHGRPVATPDLRAIPDAATAIARPAQASGPAPRPIPQRRGALPALPVDDFR